MKKVILAVLMLSHFSVMAKSETNEWTNTTISDQTIELIQQAQLKYKNCVTQEMQKKGYLKIDSRNATNAIIQQCESVLSDMRKVYLKNNVPNVIADRHLKKMRIDITRRVLKQLIFMEASRAAGAAH